MGKNKQVQGQKQGTREINTGQINKEELRQNAGIFSAFLVDENAQQRKKRNVKDRTRESLPETLTIEKMGEQLRNASYKVGKEKGEKTEHSESMNKVLLSVEAFDLFLDFPVVLEKEAFAAQIDAMEDRYRHLIADCLQYIETHNPWSKEGKVRKEKVQAIYDKATEELAALRTNAESVHAEVTADGQKTWRQIVRENRTQKYVNGKDGVKIGRAGGNTSEITTIEVNGTKKYFKPKEALAEGTFDQSYGEYVRKNNDLILRVNDPEDEEFKNMSAEDKKKLLDLVVKKVEVASDLKDFMERILLKKSDIPPKVFLEDLLKGPAALNEYVKRFPDLKNTLFYQECMGAAEGRRLRADRVKEIENAIPGLVRRGDFDRVAELQKERQWLKTDMTVVETSLGVVKDLEKFMFAASVARGGPEIEKGRNLSSRNVATSRLAEFLGIGDCVVHSEMAKIEVGGKKKEGIVMEEAGGTEMATLMEEQAYRYGEYSVNAAKQCFALQVFDIICGQTDRHIGNYTAEMKVDDHDHGVFTIEKITGIDNDMAFGLMSYERIRESGKIGSLKGIEDSSGNFVLPAMSLELAHNILALEPGMLRYIVGDVLNAREIAALTDRLQGVQKAIRGKMEQEKKAAEKAKKAKQKEPASVFLSTDQEWEGFLDDYSQKSSQEVEARTYLQPRFL